MFFLNMNTKYVQKNKGTGMVEVVLYVAIFAVLSVVVTDSLIKMTKSFAETTVYADFTQATTMFDRIGNEIRHASSINASSTSTDLKLNTTDSSGTAKTVEFLLSGNNVSLIENSTTTGNLNSPNITVNSTTSSFTQITTAEGKAVKIVFVIQDTKDKSSRTETFYDTIALRGNYLN